ncbi:MAG: ribosome biogenesis GTPase Der [Rhodothermales bacterium]|nr:ribosome biogenesis GTPase Der [Rhodothermales bacterium]
MPLVAIVGRPNVGKSTLFNRLTEERHAIVHDEPGVTRDRVYGESEWTGRTFDVVDTGGFVPRSADRFEAAIREQVRIALDEADLVVFVGDTTTGITDLDEEMATVLRRTDKPVLVVANKSDNPARRLDAAEFYRLGLGEVYPVSAVTGSGTGDFLDALVAALPEEDEEPEEEVPRIAFIGRPNVGKSSLTNKLLGEERSIVTEISGTTRDAVDARLEVDGQAIVLVDTAGLRKKAKVRENVEFYSTLRTERALRECDVAVVLLDAALGLEAQDARILRQAEELKKGLVLAVNKWDLVEKETNTARDFERAIHKRLGMLDYVPVVFISALTGQRVQKVLERALQVAEERRRRIPTSALNDVVTQAVNAHHPPSWNGRLIKIKYATQVRANPPVFAFFCNHPRGIKDPYRRYLENRLRAAFGFEGVPLTLSFKQK